MNKFDQLLEDIEAGLDESLPAEYKAPIKLTRMENEILSWYHSGQSDPVYALVSRTVGGRQTKASEEELDYSIGALEDAKDLKPDEKRVVAGLIKKLKAALKRYF